MQKNELLINLNYKLSKVDHVKQWHGVITGINAMRNDGAVSIDIGEGIKVVAGDAVLKPVSTLIARSERELFDILLHSQIGDEILFTGTFAKHGGGLVDISYTDRGRVGEPEYLFNFVKIIKPDK